eukprot:m51a1_g5426 putative nesprin-2 isoform x2 (619) ;mRNA; r:145148-147722
MKVRVLQPVDVLHHADWRALSLQMTEGLGDRIMQYHLEYRNAQAPRAQAQASQPVAVARQPPAVASTSSQSPVTAPPSRMTPASSSSDQDHIVTGEKAILLWCQKQTSQYPGVRISDFSESWRDGWALAALVHSMAPDAVDIVALQHASTEDRVKQSAAASKKSGIPLMLLPSDFTASKIDKRSFSLQMTELYYKSKTTHLSASQLTLKQKHVKALHGGPSPSSITPASAVAQQLPKPLVSAQLPASAELREPSAASARESAAAGPKKSMPARSTSADSQRVAPAAESAPVVVKATSPAAVAEAAKALEMAAAPRKAQPALSTPAADIQRMAPAADSAPVVVKATPSAVVAEMARGPEVRAAPERAREENHTQPAAERQLQAQLQGAAAGQRRSVIETRDLPPVHERVSIFQSQRRRRSIATSERPRLYTDDRLSFEDEPKPKPKLPEVVLEVQAIRAKFEQERRSKEGPTAAAEERKPEVTASRAVELRPAEAHARPAGAAATGEQRQQASATERQGGVHPENCNRTRTEPQAEHPKAVAAPEPPARPEAPKDTAVAVEKAEKKLVDKLEEKRRQRAERRRMMEEQIEKERMALEAALRRRQERMIRSREIDEEMRR